MLKTLVHTNSHLNRGVNRCVVVTFRRMLKTAINDGAEQLGLQQEITETSRVHTDVGTLLVLGVLGNVSLGSGRDGGNGLDDIIILIVVNEIVVVVGHVCKKLVGWENKGVLEDENRTGQRWGCKTF